MQPRCRHCRYTLTGLPKGLCPECGTNFDPADPTTLYNRTRFLTRLATLAPPVTLTWFASFALGGFLLLTCSPTGALSDGTAACEWYFFWPPSILWVAAATAHYFARACTRRPAPRNSRRWIAVPVVLTLGLLLRETNALWNARWRLSKSSFEAALKDPSAAPGWVGLYYVIEVQPIPNGVVYFNLGFPDTFYSQGGTEIIFCPASPTSSGRTTTFGITGSPVLTRLGKEWFASFNPT